MVNALLITSLCIVWGATWIAIKIGLSDSPPLFGAAFRFLLAVVLLLAIVWRRRPTWPRERSVWLWIAISGIFMYFGSYAVVYYVEQYIDAALAAILFSAFPFFVAVGAHFYLDHERLSTLKVTGLVIGFAGIVAVFGGGVTDASTRAWWAPAAMLLSPLCSAAASLMVKRHLTREDPYVINLLQMTVGVLLLVPAALITEDFHSFHWTSRAVGAMVFLGVFGSAYAFVTMYTLMRTMAASRLALIAFVTPVVAAILGWLVLDEQLTWATAGGAILVFVGIWIVNVLAERRLAPAVSPTGSRADSSSPTIRNRIPS